MSNNQTNKVSQSNNTSPGNTSPGNTSHDNPNMPFQFGGKSSIFTPLTNNVSYLNHHIMYLNNSKFFAGVIMILLNVGSKFITIQFSKSTEEYMKWSVSKQLLVCSTKNIPCALSLIVIEFYTS